MEVEGEKGEASAREEEFESKIGVDQKLLESMEGMKWVAGSMS